ncbi:MAG: DsbA family protein [Gemmatimonadaceae bacterium]
MRSMREWALNAATFLVTLCALLVGGMRLHAEFFSSPPDPYEPRVVAEWRDYTQDGLRIGPADAPVTIVEFADFQCPYCEKAAADLHALRERYPDDVAIIFRHFPLEGHEEAVPAARAAECANVTGHFEAFHDRLFANMDSIGKRPFREFAREAGITDLDAFDRCANDTVTVAAIERDVAFGTKLGLRGTPTFLIDSLLIGGYMGPERLEQHVRDALDRNAARRN